MLRKSYDWVMNWAHSPYATVALFLLAMAESSFFPIPPDVLLMALALSKPSKAFLYAGVSSIGSVLGGLIGYYLGFAFMDGIGNPILELYGAMDKFEYIRELYNNYDAWAVAIAGFTPIPYKVFTIAAGACEINITVFILASLFSRSARFFILAALIKKFGKPMKAFIDKYFNILTIVFVVILVAGFVGVKFLFK